MNASTEVRSTEATNILTRGALVVLNSRMARISDVQRRIRGALVLDAKRLREIADEMDKIAEAHNRYLALQRESEAHEKSAHGLAALLGPDGFYEVMTSDKSEAIGYQVEVIPSPRELRDRAALWEHVAQYLRFVPEGAQVGEILAFLAALGIETKRQAIESALRTHRGVFSVRKRGREKIVTLK